MRSLPGVVALWLLAAGVAGAQESAPRRSYYYFSKSSNPVGTATIAPERVTAKRESSRELASDKARQASWERFDGVVAEPLGVLPPLVAEEEFPLGVRVDQPLVGVRSGYEYAGRRYATHCLTAPGYEGACWSACGPAVQYRLKVRPPGLLSCLLGCHDFRYKWVAVRPRWRGEWLGARYRAGCHRGWGSGFAAGPVVGAGELAWSEPAAVLSPGRVYGVEPVWPQSEISTPVPALDGVPLGLPEPGELDVDAGVPGEIPVPLLTPPSQ